MGESKRTRAREREWWWWWWWWWFDGLMVMVVVGGGQAQAAAASALTVGVIENHGGGGELGNIGVVGEVLAKRGQVRPEVVDQHVQHVPPGVASRSAIGVSGVIRGDIGVSIASAAGDTVGGGAGAAGGVWDGRADVARADVGVPDGWGLPADLDRLEPAAPAAGWLGRALGGVDRVRAGEAEQRAARVGDAGGAAAGGVRCDERHAGEVALRHVEIGHC